MSVSHKHPTSKRDKSVTTGNQRKSISLSPSTVKLNRQFESNPFKGRQSRAQFISTKHEAILKQFSSSHFAVPTSSMKDITDTQALLASIAKFDEQEAIKHTDNTHCDSSSSNSAADGNDIDIDDTAPLIFEFPYYLNSISRNLMVMRSHFVEQHRVEALKLAIQTARLLIDDLVVSEPQFYPAIYVLVSKLLDKFGVLVYNRLHSVAVFSDTYDSTINEQYQHNFIPQSADNHEKHNKVIQISDNDNEKQKETDNDSMESLPTNFRASHCSILCQIKCGNWFFKISAIRELVPRILIEISLYRTLRFLYPLRELLTYTKMLIKRLRGISNPLIAGYVTIFALEQIFMTFGTNSFVYDDDLINEKYPKVMKPKNNMNKQKIYDFDMIEDIYLMALNDVLFILKSMYETNFMFVECVFYGQMASEDYLNLFNPILQIIFDVFKYNKVFSNLNDIKMYLKQSIDQELLKFIDFNAFLHTKQYLD